MPIQRQIGGAKGTGGMSGGGGPIKKAGPKKSLKTRQRLLGQFLNSTDEYGVNSKYLSPKKARKVIKSDEISKNKNVITLKGRGIHEKSQGRGFGKKTTKNTKPLRRKGPR